MNLKTQRRIAAKILKVGINRVRFDPEMLTEIKEAITKSDIRSLIKKGAIMAMHYHSQSRFRVRKKLEQKRKGSMPPKNNPTKTFGFIKLRFISWCVREEI